MTELRKVTDSFFVAPQISANDVRVAKEGGFDVLAMNRPDGETPDQPPMSDIVSEAESAGMTFYHIPISAPPTADDVKLTVDMLTENSDKKILAFCRSGTRSVTLWAYAKASLGDMSVDDILSCARSAGYDLSPHRPNLEMLAG